MTTADFSKGSLFFLFSSNLSSSSLHSLGMCSINFSCYLFKINLYLPLYDILLDMVEMDMGLSPGLNTY